MKQYFTNNQKNKFRNIYKSVSNAININNYDELENNSIFLRINKNKNNIISRYKRTESRNKEYAYKRDTNEKIFSRMWFYIMGTSSKYVYIYSKFLGY